MKYFGLLAKGDMAQKADAVLLGVGGLAHLFPTALAGVTGFMLGPVSVQMVVGGLSVARVIDMLFVK